MALGGTERLKNEDEIVTKNDQKIVLGIDPGLSGAIVLFGGGVFDYIVMPIKNKNEVNATLIKNFIESHQHLIDCVFLERPLAFNMPARAALNYGRGFGAIEAVVELSGLPVIYVEPKKWTKIIHQGINSKLEAKEKSLVALNRLHPKIKPLIPANRNGKLHDGVVDALLIADYGVRSL